MTAPPPGKTRKTSLQLAENALIQPARQGGDMAIELELRQQRIELAGAETAARREGVRIAGIMAQGVQHQACAGADVCSGRRGGSGGRGQVQLLEYVARAFHELGSLPDEGMAALGERR